MSDTQTKLPRFIAVVHVQDQKQALQEMEVAQEGGAGGVIFINHNPRSMPARFLSVLALEAKAYHQDYWIGVNYLDLSLNQALRKTPPTLDGLWTDESGLSPDGKKLTVDKDLLRDREKDYCVFASAFFKGRHHWGAPAEEAMAVSSWADVVVTSGPETGLAADVQQVKSMACALDGGRLPIALASGVTPQNISDYLPYVRHFLVATGISKNFHTLDLDKIREVAAIIADYDQSDTTPL